MPDPQLSPLPARANTRQERDAARRTCAVASLKAYPEGGDPRAGWDLRMLLSALGLEEEDETRG